MVRVVAAFFGVGFLVLGFLSVRRGFGSDNPATREAVGLTSVVWVLLAGGCFAAAAGSATVTWVLFGVAFVLLFVGIGRLFVRMLRVRRSRT